MNEVSPIPNQRHLFEIPDDVIYLNCASRAPQLISVRRAGESALERNAQPWKLTTADWFTESDELRALFGKLINSDAESIALVPATSYGLATAANNLTARTGDRILLVADDFPSNVYTWRAFASRTGAEILTVEKEAGQSWTEAVLEKFDERVKIIAVGNVHWTNGALIDLVEIGERARKLNAIFIVDGSQSIGAMPFDVKVIKPDFLVTVGYKWLLGAFSVSFLYLGEKHLDGKPIENNWITRKGSEDFSGLVDYKDEYQPGARRFDVGQRSNLTLNPMAIAALKQIHAWNVENIGATLSKITTLFEQKAIENGLNVLRAGQRAAHSIGLELPAADQNKIASALANEKIYVGVRGRSIRIAPHLYNTEAEVERFYEVLMNALR